MTTIAILPVEGEDNQTTFSAVTTRHKATGRTAGEALDALTAQLSAEETPAHVIIQQFLPDQFFSAAQRDRLSTLMARWRAARETGDTLPPEEQAELERLVDEEVQGSTERATHILRDLETAPFRRRDDETRAELRIRHAQEAQRTLRLYVAYLLANVFGFILFLTGCILVLFGVSLTGAIVLLIMGGCVQAASLGFYLLHSGRWDAARKRAGSFYQRADAIERRKTR